MPFTYRMRAGAGPHFLATVAGNGTVRPEDLTEVKPGQIITTADKIPEAFMDKFEEITGPDLAGAEQDDEIPEWIDRTDKFPAIEAKGLQVFKLRGAKKYKVTQGEEIVFEVEGSPSLVDEWFTNKSKTEKVEKKKKSK